MDEQEFRAYARQEGYREPEHMVRKPNHFFALHAHKEDLIFWIEKGVYIVDYGEKKDVFGPGDMGFVKADVDGLPDRGEQLDGAAVPLHLRHELHLQDPHAPDGHVPGPSGLSMMIDASRKECSRVAESWLVQG